MIHTSVPHDTNIELSSAIDLIINKYEMHPSIIKVKDSVNRPTSKESKRTNIEKLIKKLR